MNLKKSIYKKLENQLNLEISIHEIINGFKNSIYGSETMTLLNKKEYKYISHYSGRRTGRAGRSGEYNQLLMDLFNNNNIFISTFSDNRTQRFNPITEAFEWNHREEDNTMTIDMLEEAALRLNTRKMPQYNFLWYLRGDKRETIQFRMT